MAVPKLRRCQFLKSCRYPLISHQAREAEIIRRRPSLVAKIRHGALPRKEIMDMSRTRNIGLVGFSPLMNSSAPAASAVAT